MCGSINRRAAYHLARHVWCSRPIEHPVGRTSQLQAATPFKCTTLALTLLSQKGPDKSLDPQPHRRHQRDVSQKRPPRFRYGLLFIKYRTYPFVSDIWKSTRLFGRPGWFGILSDQDGAPIRICSASNPAATNVFMIAKARRRPVAILSRDPGA